MTYFDNIKSKAHLTARGTVPNHRTRVPRPGRGRPARYFDAATGTWTPPRQRVPPVGA